MHTLAISFTADAGGNSQKVAFTNVSAASTALAAGTKEVLVTVDQPAFMRMSADPTAVADGTDMYLNANVMYRVTVVGGMKLAFIRATANSGNAWITPEN